MKKIFFAISFLICAAIYAQDRQVYYADGYQMRPNTPPTSAINGEIYTDQTTGRITQWDGLNWNRYAIFSEIPAPQVLSLSSNNLTIDQSLSTVDLTPYLDNTDDQTAVEVSVSTTNFDNNLSASDNTVQAALDTLDDMVSSGSNQNASQVPYTNNSQTTVEGALDDLYLGTVKVGINPQFTAPFAISNDVGAFSLGTNNQIEMGSSGLGVAVYGETAPSANDQFVQITTEETGGGQSSTLTTKTNVIEAKSPRIDLTATTRLTIEKRNATDNSLERNFSFDNAYDSADDVPRKADVDAAIAGVSGGSGIQSNTTGEPTGTEAITKMVKISLADYNTAVTAGTLVADTDYIIKDPKGMEEAAAAATINWKDANGYLIDKHIYVDNTNADIAAFDLTNMEIGYLAEFYLNQATEPTFTPPIADEVEGTLDWTADNLANTNVTLFVWRSGKSYRKTYIKGQ